MGALKLQASFDDLAKRAASLTPEEFVKQYAHFTVAVQNCISTTGAPPHPMLPHDVGVALPAGASLVNSAAASLSAR
jgi:hypothetical protein